MRQVEGGPKVMRPMPSSLKRMFIDYMWDWLTPTLVFALCYTPASIAIILFAEFYIGSEFVTGFCFGGVAVSGCVIISDLYRGYQEFKRQTSESDNLIRQMDGPAHSRAERQS